MDETDYIIVGAGSAGCVLANRLSENGKHQVTVLEAGGTDLRFFVQMPLGYGKLFYDPAVNWMYKSEPDPGLAGNADHIPRGKLLGGSSSITPMKRVSGGSILLHERVSPGAIRYSSLTVMSAASSV